MVFAARTVIVKGTIIGVLADRARVRYFVILAPATTAVPMSLIGIAPSYGVLLLLLFITGISVSIFHVPAPVIISRIINSGEFDSLKPANTFVKITIRYQSSQGGAMDLRNLTI